jgi:flagellar biogenesis protein FliO
VFFRSRKNFVLPSPSAGAGSGLTALMQRFLPVLNRRASVGGMLEHLGTMPLTAQSSLALVRLQGETLLLGITPQTITVLTKGNAASTAPQAPETGAVIS